MKAVFYFSADQDQDSRPRDPRTILFADRDQRLLAVCLRPRIPGLSAAALAVVSLSPCIMIFKPAARSSRIALGVNFLTGSEPPTRPAASICDGNLLARDGSFYAFAVLVLKSTTSVNASSFTSAPFTMACC